MPLNRLAVFLFLFTLSLAAKDFSRAWADDKKEATGTTEEPVAVAKPDAAVSDKKVDGDEKASKKETQPNAEAEEEIEVEKEGVGEKEADETAPSPLFPDKALEAAVRAVVFEKRFNQEPLTKEDVAKIPHVIGRGKGIKSLEGLQHCVSLMKIDLENNEITDLAPIKGLTKLISLSVAGNQVTDISALEPLVKLQLLDLSRNRIKNLEAVAKMLNLRDLWVAQNLIADLKPVANLPKIWYLDIAKNQVSDLSVVGKLKWLTTLDVSQNQVTDLKPLASLEDLDLLLFSKNQIRDLSPLVAMCVADAQGERRFAPYLEVYLGENPLEESRKSQWLEQLRSAGVDVFDK